MHFCVSVRDFVSFVSHVRKTLVFRGVESHPTVPSVYRRTMRSEMNRDYMCGAVRMRDEKRKK
jgi:hypothetical protein